MSQLEFNKLQWTPLVMALLISLSVALPYFTAVGLGHVDPFVPFISYAAAFPPQSAYLSIFVTSASPLALVTFAIKFVIIDHRRNPLGKKNVQILNISSFVFGLLAILSMIYTSYFPIGFVHNDRQWVHHVVVPHLIGMVSLFLFFTCYVLTQAYLTYLMKNIYSPNVFVHGMLGMFVVITCWTTFIPFYAALKDITKKVVDKVTGAVNLEYMEYDFFYVICALSGWGFIFFTFLFMATFYKDFQSARMKIELKPKVRGSIKGQVSARRVRNDREVTKM